MHQKGIESRSCQQYLIIINIHSTYDTWIILGIILMVLYSHTKSFVSRSTTNISVVYFTLNHTPSSIGAVDENGFRPDKFCNKKQFSSYLLTSLKLTVRPWKKTKTLLARSKDQGKFPTYFMVCSFYAKLIKWKNTAHAKKNKQKPSDLGNFPRTICPTNPKRGLLRGELPRRFTTPLAIF